MTRNDLEKYIGKKVKVDFGDFTSKSGKLIFVEKWKDAFGQSIVNHFRIGNTFFKASSIAKIRELRRK